MEIVLIEEIHQYLKELSNAEREQAYRYFNRQRDLAYRLLEPVSKHLRGYMCEIRPGPHRFLFFYHRGKIVVIHAFRKKTRTTPEREIGIAIRRRARFIKEEPI